MERISYWLQIIVDCMLNNNLSIDKATFFTVIIGQITIYGILLTFYQFVASYQGGEKAATRYLGINITEYFVKKKIKIFNKIISKKMFGVLLILEILYKPFMTIYGDTLGASTITQITIINELSKHDELMEFNSIVKWVQCMRYNKFAQQNSFPEKLNITLRGLLLTNVNAVVVANYTYLSCYINVIGTYLLIKLHELSDKTQKQKRIKEIVKKAFTASNMNIDEYINMIEKECRICRCEINYVQKEKMKEYLMKTF